MENGVTFENQMKKLQNEIEDSSIDKLMEGLQLYDLERWTPSPNIQTCLGIQ